MNDPEYDIKRSAERRADPRMRARVFRLAIVWAKQMGYGDVTDIVYEPHIAGWCTWSETFTPRRQSFRLGRTLDEAWDFLSREIGFPPDGDEVEVAEVREWRRATFDEPPLIPPRVQVEPPGRSYRYWTWPPDDPLSIDDDNESA